MKLLYQEFRLRNTYLDYNFNLNIPLLLKFITRCFIFPCFNSIEVKINPNYYWYKHYKLV